MIDLIYDVLKVIPPEYLTQTIKIAGQAAAGSLIGAGAAYLINTRLSKKMQTAKDTVIDRAYEQGQNQRASEIYNRLQELAENGLTITQKGTEADIQQLIHGLELSED